MSVPATFKRCHPTLGCGKIGDVTEDHINRCNAWLKPLAERDGFEQSPNLGALDIRNLLEMGRASSVVFALNIHQADSLRTMLLIDMGNVVRTIRWGMAPQEDEVVPEVRFRLTARGRRMLMACCGDLWASMLYGDP